MPDEDQKIKLDLDENVQRIVDRVVAEAEDPTVWRLVAALAVSQLNERRILLEINAAALARFGGEGGLIFFEDSDGKGMLGFFMAGDRTELAKKVLESAGNREPENTIIRGIPAQGGRPS